MNRRPLASTVAAALLLLSACGAQPTIVANPPPSTPIAERGVSCGDTPYPREALRGPTGAEDSDHPAAELLRKEIELVEGAELRPTDEWRLVVDGPDNAVFAGGASEDLAESGLNAEYRAEKVDGEWRTAGISFGCRPSVDTGGQSRVDFYLAPGTDLDPEATSIPGLVQDPNCGGRDVLDRIDEPLIEYGPDEVLVLLTADPLEGFHTCEGFPPSEYTLELAEPIGQRKLLDAGFYPAVEVHMYEGVLLPR